LQPKQGLHQSDKDFVFKLVTIVLPVSVAITLAVQLLSFIFISPVMGQTTTSQPMFSNNSIISTRGHFNYSSSGQLIPDHNSTDYDYYKSITGDNVIVCPTQKEIVIYIHGAWTDERSANEQFNRTAISLASNNYSIPLTGFSWDSNVPINKDGWETAKIIAEKNGVKLAQFVIDFKNKCKDTDIRFIAHSLGAAVVNSTLTSLNSNQVWNDKSGLNITSVHLLGAAIDRSSVAANTTFGNAINRVVGNFYNIRDSEDNMLQYVYRYVEGRNALGLLGISHSMPIPKNYFERQVDSEIPPLQDVDGNSRLDCFDFFVILPGDNHCGYIGARGLPPFEDISRNDGAIDIVVQDWLDQS